MNALFRGVGGKAVFQLFIHVHLLLRRARDQFQVRAPAAASRSVNAIDVYGLPASVVVDQAGQAAAVLAPAGP